MYADKFTPLFIQLLPAANYCRWWLQFSQTPSHGCC